MSQSRGPIAAVAVCVTATCSYVSGEVYVMLAAREVRHRFKA